MLQCLCQSLREFWAFSNSSTISALVPTPRARIRTVIGTFLVGPLLHKIHRWSPSHTPAMHLYWGLRYWKITVYLPCHEQWHSRFRQTHELTDNNSLSTIDHKCACCGHQRQISHENLMFIDFFCLFVNQSYAKPSKALHMSHHALYTARWSISHLSPQM